MDRRQPLVGKGAGILFCNNEMNNLLADYKNSTAFKIVCALAVFIIFYYIAGFVLPIMLAIALAFVLQPIADLFLAIRIGPARMKLSRNMGIVMSFVVMGLFIYLMVVLIVLPLLGEINHFLKSLPEFMKKLDASNLDLIGLGNVSRSEIPSNLLTLIDSMVTWSISYALEMLQTVVKSTFQFAAIVVGLIVVPFLAFYFMRDWRELRALIIGIFSIEAQPKAANIFDELGSVLSDYVQGMFKLCLLVGLCITIGVYFLGMEYPLILGFMAMLAEVIPVVGPIAISVPAAFLAYADSPVSAIKIMTFYFVFYQIDAHYLLPKIMGNSIKIHPVLLILSLLLGAKLFGILGLIFAVPMAAVCKVFYKHLWHQRSEETADDFNG